MKTDSEKIYRNAVVLIVVLSLLIIVVSLRDKSEPVSMVVLPNVPKEELPVFVTFNLNNPYPEKNMMNYEFYANGVLLMQGRAHLGPYSTEQYSYVYPESPKLGERVTFVVRTESGRGQYDKVLSMPAYPPQVWSSFVSFASFSTSLMTSSISTSMGAVITSKQYYTSSFGNDKINVGNIFSLTLILLLVYLEVTEPIKKGTFTIIRGLRIRFSRLTTVLLIIFSGMVFTRMALSVI